MVFFLLKLGESNPYLRFASGFLIDSGLSFNLMSFQGLFALEIRLIRPLIQIN
jgi:hypothetical protein